MIGRPSTKDWEEFAIKARASRCSTTTPNDPSWEVYRELHHRAAQAAHARTEWHCTVERAARGRDPTSPRGVKELTFKDGEALPTIPHVPQMPREFTFVNRLQWGLASVMGGLGTIANFLEVTEAVGTWRARPAAMTNPLDAPPPPGYKRPQWVTAQKGPRSLRSSPPPAVAWCSPPQRCFSPPPAGTPSRTTSTCSASACRSASPSRSSAWGWRSPITPAPVSSRSRCSPCALWALIYATGEADFRAQTWLGYILALLAVAAAGKAMMTQGEAT